MEEKTRLIAIVVLGVLAAALIFSCTVLSLNDKDITAFIGLAGVAMGGIAGVVVPSKATPKE